MPAPRITMRQFKEVLRLKWGCGLSDRQIARSCGIARPTVADYIKRAQAVGLSWPLAQGLDDAALAQWLFPPAGSPVTAASAIPDWAVVHQELKRKGVTLFLLWHEYKAVHPEGCQYSTFTLHYRQWRGTLNPVMRQLHRAGEKLFVDYAGHTVPVIDRGTGEIRTAQIFVAVLGASNYTYAEATWTQSLPDWIGSHVRAFEFFGGVSELLVPDNLRSGVRAAHRYEPEINPTYAELCAHYRIAVLPARVHRPRDKAKVEVGVQIVERWVLARLRHQQFFSLAELNAAIRTLLHELNHKPFKKLPGSRHTLFESIDRPALRALPDTPYEFAEWKKVKAHLDYHVEVNGHYYSVPYQLISQTLEARFTASTVEIFYKGRRVASHLRAALKGRYTTLPEHMPPAHQAYTQWTPERLIQWAEKTGPATAAVIATVLRSRPHPQQGFRTSLGILRLSKTYGEERLEAACQRALALQACRYKSIESILKHGLDRQTLPLQAAPNPLIEHPNIRGAHYYH